MYLSLNVWPYIPESF